LADARSKGILFYLLTVNVLIGFLGCLMRNSQLKDKFECYSYVYSGNATHQADGKPIYLDVSGK